MSQNITIKPNIPLRVVRMMVEAKGADATIFAAEMWGGRPTAAAANLSREELGRLLSEPEYRTGVDLGLIEREELVAVQAQDAQESLLVQQAFRRDRGQIVYSGERREERYPQSAVTGSTKMFGSLYPIRAEAERILNKVLSGMFPKEKL